MTSHSLFRSPGRKSPITTGVFAMMRRSRKPVYVQAYRGFESPPLRYEIRGICSYAGSFPVYEGLCGGALSAAQGRSRPLLEGSDFPTTSLQSDSEGLALRARS
jgi:hypothetical protein